MKQNIGAALALYPTPVVVVGAMNGEKPTWTLAAHVGIIGHDRILVSLASAHFINGCIKACGRLSVNLVDEALLPKADYVGSVSGAKEDKSAVFPCTAGENGAPMIDAAPLSMTCTVADIYTTEGFESFVCTIDHTYVEEAYLTKEGKIDYQALKPVLFEFPTYSYLKTGEVLGKCLTFQKAPRPAQEETAPAKPKVYFTREITPEKVVELYHALGITLPGKVAVKVHSGEKGNQNFLHPDFWKPMVDEVHGTVVECNTAYGDASGGVRDHTKPHWKLLTAHGWTKYFDVDLMDAEGPDVVWPIPGGKVLKENRLGKNIEHYDSMLVLAHFKGHPAGGYGGALKQLSIGCASRAGKALIHSAGKTDDRYKTWEQHADNVAFPEAMADAALSVAAHFQGKIAYINVMKNLSVDCDCCAVAEDPCMADIGILASLDPVAIDQACIDLVMASDDPGKEHFMERVNSRNGIHTIEAAAALGMGSRDYELIEV